MTQSRTTLLTAAVAITASLVAIHPAFAGGCSRGGHSSGHYSGHANSYHRYDNHYNGNHYHHQPVQRYNYSQAQYPPVQVIPQQVAPPPVQTIPQTVPSQQIAVGRQTAPAPQTQVIPAQVVQPSAPTTSVRQASVSNTAQPSAPAPSTGQVDVTQSALQALGGFAPPAETPAEQQTQTIAAPPAHVGIWRATIGNGSTVQLNLQADGRFSWEATNKSGDSSTFRGSYSVDSGSLTLKRSLDNQALAGSMTQKDSNSFTFQLSSSNAGALNFVRS